MKQEDLREIAAELQNRPGHEKVRAHIHRLLTDGLGAKTAEIDFERQVPEVRGRIDALLGRTLFEIKSDLRRERKDADAQLLRYLPQREKETNQRFVGIATDGADFVVAVMRDDKLAELGTYRTRADDPRDLLRWLESVVVLQTELPPDILGIRRELGRESVHYRRALQEIEALWNGLKARPEAILKRDLWNRLLRVAYGGDVEAPDLFLQHTYLTIVAKSVATLALLDTLPPNGEALLTGQAFRDLGIVGAIESDFFDWILLEPEGDDLVMEIARHANRFKLRDINADILKGLYESLIDPSQRHDLGEYYTPDWLAARIVEATVKRPLADRVIDPACGSGTFLFHAVRNLLAAAEKHGQSSADAVALACEKVAGIDIHPVAVIFARATYLLALQPSLVKGRPSSFSVPVYIGDALQWNAREFMNQRDLEIVVPAAGESATRLPDDDVEGRIILRFPTTVASEPGLFDATLNEMLRLAQRDQTGTALQGWLKRQHIIAPADVSMLTESYEALRRLQGQGRNHIWGYVARNLSRPIWLASEKQKADVVVGNPPWLAYRAMNKPTQKRFMEEMKASGLWGGLSSVSGYDLSAYFFARAVQLYMRQSGTIGFVLPFAAMTRKPYALFRKGTFKVGGYSQGTVQFTDAWAFPSDVQPLFPVPSCVLFAQRTRVPKPLPNSVLFFSGKLSHRDAHPDEAHSALQEHRAPWPSESDDAEPSTYKGRFRNGAVLWPRRLVIVTEVAQGRLGANPAAPIVQGRVTNLDKKPWNNVPPIRGPVERDFLRTVYLGESIAPYRLLEPVKAVIPIEPKSNVLMDARAAAGKGYARLSALLADAETTWRTHSKQARTFVQQVDFFGNLSGQFALAPLRVLYTKTGTNLAASVLRDQQAIVENGLYWAAATSEDEAHYLAAVLNSETTRARAEKWQATGQWGARHFDKVIFNLPIPKFEPKTALHVELAKVAKEAEKIAEGVPLKPGEHFTRARKRIRDALTEAGVAERIDALTGRLLDKIG
jgi:hypothetical protein